jgi:hypothetical protein
MKVARFLAIVFLAVLPLTAQKETTEEKTNSVRPQNWPVKMFQVKYANVNRLASVFNTFGASIGATISADGDLKVLTVRAPQEILVAIEESIKRLDVQQPAAKNIAIDAYLLVASAQGSVENVPPDLEGVVQQLKNIFKYHGFRLIATSSLRMRDGSGGETKGVLPSVGAGLMPTNYEFRVGSSAITSDSKERVIRIDGLKLALRVPIKTSDRDWSYQEAHISTSIDIHEGQKVVVGKANIDNADNALILVLTAKVIE